MYPGLLRTGERSGVLFLPSTSAFLFLFFSGMLTLKICSNVKGTSCRFRQVVLVKRRSFTAQSCNVKAERLSRDKTTTQVIARFGLLFLRDVPRSPIQGPASGGREG